MEAVNLTNDVDKVVAARRKPSPVRIPRYDLGDAVHVAKMVHERGGGVASREQLAAFLGHKTTNSGAFLLRLASARLFGTIDTRESSFIITPLAQKVLMPVYPDQMREGLIEAFFNVPVFKSIYEEHKGKDLPPEFGMKNLLRNKYSVPPDMLATAYRTLIESADTAGFFATRGTRTHLIVPQMSQGRAQVETQEEAPVPVFGGGGGGGSGLPPQQPPQSAEQVKLEYVRKLISLLGSDAVDQDQLMTRIERLLATN